MVEKPLRGVEKSSVSVTVLSTKVRPLRQDGCDKAGASRKRRGEAGRENKNGRRVDDKKDRPQPNKND